MALEPTAQAPAEDGAAAQRAMRWIGEKLGFKKSSAPLGFDAVFKDELRAIRARRSALDVLRTRPLAVEENLAEEAWVGRLLGLSFSGGGIRSATFNLGVLQALARHGLLRHVDYLSTVSGGGYIGSWLTALSQRAFALPWRASTKTAKKPAPSSGQAELAPRLRFDKQHYQQFERELAWSAGSERDGRDDPGETREARAIRFLREYSNYLTPKLGVFSADTWALISIYVRNALLNQLVLIFALAFVLLLPRFLSSLVGVCRTPEDGPAVCFGLPAEGFWLVFVAIGSLIVAWNLGVNLAGINDQHRAKPNPPSSLGVIGWMLVPMLLIGIGAAKWMPLLNRWIDEAVRGAAEWMPLLSRWIDGGAWGAAALLGGVASAAVWSLAWLAALSTPWPQKQQKRFWWRMLAVAPFSGLLFGVGIHAAGSMLAHIDYSGFAIMVSAPLLALGVLTAGVLHVGLAGKGFPSQYTEWLSRFGGLTMIGALGWLGFSALVFYGPFLIALLPGYLNAALASGWVVTTLSAALFGRSSATSSASVLRPVLTTVAPWIFILGLLLLLAIVVQQLLWRGAALAGLVDPSTDFVFLQSQWNSPATWAAYEQWLQAPEMWWFVGLVAVGTIIVVFVLSRRIDINTFSLNSMYGNRLVRCYLGASVEERWANPFSGLSGRDDLSLFAVPQYTSAEQPVYAHADVDGVVARRIEEPNLETTAYPGPYHLLNTAINLVAGRSLAWQERKAASFLLSPLYCGYRQLTARGSETELTDAYRRTEQFSSDPKCLTLGEAVATSGAAASPNMGYHSSPAFAFLMGVFNIRLGRWVGNPGPTEEEAHKELWKTTGPGVAIWHLLREVFGLTNSDSGYVYLSDGGHFENLGLYELVRRRCRYVIVCDAGADPNYGFEDLANAIRKCRVDLGVEIDLDVKEIAETDALRYNAAPCAIGSIRYSDQHVGTLLYIKACRRQGFPSDIMNYAAENAAFPHETTADQFFSESQFESYRRLGHFLANQILTNAVTEASAPDGSDVDIPTLFRCLRQNWHRSSASVTTHFSALARATDELFERQRTSPDLAFLSRQFYPEWRELMKEPRNAVKQADDMWEVPTDPKQMQQAFFFCNSLIQLMEAVYVDLDLESEWDHPDNSGWLNLFNHWSWSGMFRVAWAVSAAQYGRRFRTFCRQRLGLKLGEVSAIRAFPGESSSADATFAEALEASGLNLLEIEQVKTLTKGMPLAEVSLYRLELGVEIKLVEDQEPRVLRSFIYGYALLQRDELVMFRVQDHLRTMDLGRQGLTKLAKLRSGARITLGDNATILGRLKRITERAQEARVNEFRAMLASITEDG
jgi:hypothetical protein